MAITHRVPAGCSNVVSQIPDQLQFSGVACSVCCCADAKLPEFEHPDADGVFAKLEPRLTNLKSDNAGPECAGIAECADSKHYESVDAGSADRYFCVAGFVEHGRNGQSFASAGDSGT
jgi:hypothetical protein